MEENPIEKKESTILPGFLYRDKEGRIYTGAWADSEITSEYHQFLVESRLTPRSLPPFFYESNGEVYMGAPDDSDVTEMWKNWLKQSE